MTAGADLRLLRTAVFTAVCVTLSAAGHSLTGGGNIPVWSLGVACAAVFAVAAPLAGRERSLPGIAGLLALGQAALHTLFSCGGATAPRAAAGAAPKPSPGGGAGEDVRALAARLLCDEQAAGTISDARARQVVTDAGLDPSRLGGHTAAGHGHLQHAAGHHSGPRGGGSSSAPETPLECLRSAADAALALLDGPMVAAHLFAALMLGLLLRRGEAALWELVRISARSARGAAGHVRSLGTALAYVRRAGESLPQLPDGAVRNDDTAGQCPPRSLLLAHSVHRRGPPPGTRDDDFFALAA